MKRALPSCVVALMGVLVFLPACNFYKTKIETPDIEAGLKKFSVESPTKLHLKDGSVVLYDNGFVVKGNEVVGDGDFYDLTRSGYRVVTNIPVQDIAYLEYYDEEHRPVISGLATAGVIGGGTFGGLLLYKAIFGSCPTVYSGKAQGENPEAELFSHSINRRYEMPDLDLLSAAYDSDGVVSLRLANEALETHYINRIELVAVDHPAGFKAVPTSNQEVLIVGPATELVYVRNSKGEDIAPSITASDGSTYRSSRDMLESYVDSAVPDWIELSVKLPEGAREAYMTMRARNSLLSTVFIYDMAMASQGFHAIDWIGSESTSPLYALNFSKWFQKNFGIDVEIYDGNVYRKAGHIAPTGPIAWHEVGMKIAVRQENELRIRLSYLPDNWVFDSIDISFSTAEIVNQQTYIPTKITSIRGNNSNQPLENLHKKDRDYFITYPGDLYQLQFAAEAVVPELERSYFLSSSGYYIEWLRMDWIESNGSYGPTRKLIFDKELLQQTAQRWLLKKDEMDRKFYSSRLPLEG